MKHLFIILTAVVVAEQTVDHETNLKWDNFQRDFQKNYNSETAMRYQIFKENLKQIDLHNKMYDAGHVTYKQGITPFTDWTTDEFQRYISKSKLSFYRNGTTYYSPMNNSEVPDFVDWRLKRAVREVKNQGHCGSCWSFSATGAMEGQAEIVLGKRISLSEQNLLDCAAGISYRSYGCDGGNIVGAFLYAKDKGIDEELNYPYKAHQGECKQSTPALYVKAHRWVDPPTEERLQIAVAQIGPISVAIEATSLLQNYAGGVFYDHTCTHSLNHGVLAVGYGVENGSEYWLIKNSWGPSWGEQGYLKLARNRFNNCGVADEASYPIL